MSWPSHVRVAVSQRVVEHDGYTERRDALAQDWVDCFEQWKVLPAIVPNRWPDPAGFLQDWGIEALLLTGGNDLGEAVDRDATERALLAAAEATHLPVLGVCRGAQLLNDYLGGSLRAAPAHASPPHHHQVRLNLSTGPERESVNSFHSQAIDRLADAYVPWAVTSSGEVEGFVHQSRPWLGVMWHPERTGGGSDSLMLQLGQFLRGIPWPLRREAAHS